MLALGIWSHISFMLKLRAWRHELAEAQVIVAQDTFPLSTILVIAAALMAIGVAAFVDMILRYSGTK